MSYPKYAVLWQSLPSLYSWLPLASAQIKVKPDRRFWQRPATNIHLRTEFSCIHQPFDDLDNMARSRRWIQTNFSGPAA